MEKAKNVIEYYVLCNRLKDIIRTGWKDWGVKRKRVESVAEHVYGVQMLAIAMWSEYKYDIDLEKTLTMLAVHELEEILIGDLTMFDIDRKTKKQKGIEAVEKITTILSNGTQIKDLILEFNNRQTKEAQFAFFCDKLECDIQCRLYDLEKCVNIEKQQKNKTANTPYVKKLIEKNKSWSKAWLEFGRNNYKYDENFTEVSNYVSNNDITK